jgi:hypothetical protein
MNTGTANPTNRWLFVITAMCGAGLLGLFLLVLLRHREPPVDLGPLQREISHIKTANAELQKTLEKSVQAAPNNNKDAAARAAAEAEIKKLEATNVRLNAALEERLKDLQAKLQDAAVKGDAAREKELKRAVEIQQKQADELKKALESFAAEVAANRARASDPTPTPTTTPSPTPPEETSGGPDEIVKNVLRVGALILCVANPELTPIIAIIARELGLFGNDTQTRTDYMHALHDAVEGRPISEETRKRLVEAGQSGKIPPKMVEHLDELLRKLPNGGKIRETLPGFPEEWRRSFVPPDDLSEAIRKGLKDKSSLEKLRDLFPKAEGKPYYPSKKIKDEVEAMFTTEFFDRIPELWEGPQGLKEIPIRKE